MCKYFSHKEASLESLMILNCNFTWIILQVALGDFVLVLVEQMPWTSWLIFHGNLNAPRFVVLFAVHPLQFKEMVLLNSLAL